MYFFHKYTLQPTSSKHKRRWNMYQLWRDVHRVPMEQVTLCNLTLTPQFGRHTRIPPLEQPTSCLTSSSPTMGRLILSQMNSFSHWCEIISGVETSSSDPQLRLNKECTINTASFHHMLIRKMGRFTRMTLPLIMTTLMVWRNGMRLWKVKNWDSVIFAYDEVNYR